MIELSSDASDERAEESVGCGIVALLVILPRLLDVNEVGKVAWELDC